MYFVLTINAIYQNAIYDEISYIILIAKLFICHLASHPSIYNLGKQIRQYYENLVFTDFISSHKCFIIFLMTPINCLFVMFEISLSQ